MEACGKKDPNGVVTQVHKGHVPAPSQSVARDVAQEVVRPPMAGRGLDRYAGHQVPDPSRSHRTARTERAQVDVETFMGRMMPHPVPKGCTRIRYEGVPAPKTFAKGKVLMQEVWAKVENVGKGAVQSMARLTSRQRDAPSTGRDPFICPHGRGVMGVWRLWHPAYGVIDDEGQGIKRGTYEPTAPRAGP